jgi:hypothetical protein
VPSAEHCDRLVLNQASLPKARQWLEWLTYHYDRLPAAAGWQRGLRDTLLELHHCVAISARRLRGNPIWDFQGTMTTDTEPLETMAHRALARFESINRKDVPERFADLMLCLYGALRQQIRLAREIDLMREMGHINVDVLLDQKTVTLTEQ